MASKAHPPSNDILTTTLYGESDAWAGIDEVHCEPLIERSARHDWEIKPHRHLNLVQMFLLTQGQCNAEIDRHKQTLSAGSLVVLPEQSVHGFHWQPNSYGYVVMVSQSLVKRIESKIPLLQWCRGQATVLEHHGQELTTQFEQLLREYSSPRAHRTVVLEALTTNLLIAIDRLLNTKQLSRYDNIRTAEKHLQPFMALIEQHFSQHHQVEWYANRLAISAAHLNSLCKQQRRTTALKLIHQRLLHEAQRQLIYSSKTVAELANQLGFDDPAYFNRFFKRAMGCAPGQFRKQWHDPAYSK